MDLTLDQYSKLHGQVRDAYLVKTKKLITAGFKHITDTIEDIVVNDSFTFENLARRLKRGTGDSLFDAFDNRISDLEKKGKIGTSVWYKCARNSIKSYANKDLKFADITPTWLEKYQAHLLDEGKEYTTISINMRALRAILNEGKANGITTESQYPFAVKNNGKYAIPEGAGRKIALNAAQFIDVINYPILPELEKWRDLWIFSFYCNGANISDILRFKYENIVDGNYIEWHRRKTTSRKKEKIKIKAVISPEMRTIIETYGNPDTSPHNYIFNYLRPGLSPLQENLIIKNTIHNINRLMTSIGKALGISKLTTYAARHSWASISRREGVSLFGISKGMGHQSLATTQIYLDSLSDDELNANAAKLPRMIKL